MTKKTKAISSILGLFIISLILTIAFFTYQFVAEGPSNDTTEVVFDVEPGQTMAAVAIRLEEQKIIKNSWLFSKWSRLKGMSQKLKRGEYALHRAMTPNEVLAVITSGKSKVRSLTIPEGKNIFEIAEIFEKNGYGTRDGFFKIVKDQNYIQQVLGEKIESLEGYLFPDTYMVTKFDTQQEIIQQMLNHFLKIWTEIEPLARKTGWSRHQFLTFASIVEKESGHPEDRTKVSSVFHNRLKLNMRLQTDPTVIYGKAIETGTLPANITRMDLQTPNRYNTYTIYGLPPTPISNPGRDAMIAAAQPQATKYLYFVSRNDGTTAFSETLTEHNKAVQTFQINSQNREGKSWRDLKKNN